MDLNELIGKKVKVDIKDLSYDETYYNSSFVLDGNNYDVCIYNDGDYEPNELLGTSENCLITDYKDGKLIGFLMTDRKFINDMIRISNKLKETGEYEEVIDIYLMERLKIKNKIMGLYMVDKEEMGKYYLGTVEIGKFYKKQMDNHIVFKDKKVEDELGKQIRDVIRSIDLTKKEISIIEEEKRKKRKIEDGLGIDDREIVGMVTLDLSQKILLKKRINIENNNEKINEINNQNLNKIDNKEKETTNVKQINVKQELEMNDWVTDFKTLGQVLEKNGKLPEMDGKKFTKMGVIESDQRDDIRDVNGEFAKKNTTRFAFVAIANDGTVVPLDLEQDHEEGRNPMEQNYQINRRGEVIQDDVSSRYRIGDGTFSIKKGQMGEIEVYHSQGKTIGGEGIEGNKSLDRQLETNNVWYMKKDQRDLAAEYQTNYRTVQKGYEEAKEHEDETGRIKEGDRLNAKDIDGKKHTKSHTHYIEER